tara:strand:+ start:2427 stop:2702 length:276 start_codon:yes stop_codon:yes gene_type:complete
MASINLVKLTDTFNTFMDLVNSIINKINKIEVDNSTAKLKFSTSNPADADLSTSEAILFFDSTGKLKIKRKLSNNTYEVKFVTVSDSDETS